MIFARIRIRTKIMRILNTIIIDKMMANIHLAGEEEDMYSGYGREDVAPELNTEDLGGPPDIRCFLSEYRISGHPITGNGQISGQNWTNQ